MERLRETQHISDPLLADGVKLLRATGPLERSPFVEARVLARIEATKRQAAPAQRRWATAIAAIALIGLASAASAMMLRRAQDARRLRAVKAISDHAKRNRSMPIPQIAAPPVVPTPVAHVRPRKIAVVSESRPKTTEPAVPADDEIEAGAALVLEATSALRNQHDPKRAGRLLDDYLNRYPSGVLAEEALALAIEAAAAGGDDRARTLASKYLRNYPKGRFRDAAQNAKLRFGN